MLVSSWDKVCISKTIVYCKYNINQNLLFKEIFTGLDISNTNVSQILGNRNKKLMFDDAC